MYHRRASREFQQQVDDLRESNSVLEQYLSDADQTLRDTQKVLDRIEDDAAIARKYAAAGTPDDPDFPYK